MPNLTEIVKDPNFVNANAETKKAIFEKYAAKDQNYAAANSETKDAIKKKYGIEDESINWGRLAATTAGGVVGGIVAAPAAGLAAIPTAGLGGLATEAAGVGLGAGMGGQLYDIGERLFGEKQTEKPLTQQSKEAAVDVAENALMVPGARALSEGVQMAAPYVAPYARALIEKIPFSTAKAKRLANALIGKARETGENIAYTASKDKISAGQERVAAEAAADKARKTALALQEQAETLPVITAQPKPVKIGEAREATAEIGAPVKAATEASQRNLEAQRLKTDSYLRQSRNAVVNENQANGVRIIDQPSYKRLIEKTEPIVNWQRSGVRAPDPSIANTYKELIRRVSPQTVELSAEDAAIAAKNGIAVRSQDGKFYREVEPTFESIDEARRFLGEVFSGKAPEGYGAIKGQEQKDLYSLLSKIEEEYVGKAQPRLQANWREATNKIKSFEEGIGPKIVKTEPEKIASVLFKNKGSGSFDEAIAATGDERIARKALSDQIATDISGKDYKKAVTVYNQYKQVLQNPKLASLKSRVEAHLKELNDNEIAGVKTKDLVLNLEKQSAEQSAIAKQKALEAKSASRQEKESSVQERNSMNAISEIFTKAEKDPQNGADAAMSYFKNLADSGKISPEEYRSILSEYNKIDFKRPAEAKAATKKWLGRIAKYGAIASGAGGTYFTLKNITGDKGYTP